MSAANGHPQASYEQVVADRELFLQTLEDLHRSLGTKFMVPTIGGKPLDLHFLFLEVTSRGGIQKVIADRRWKEVTTAFSFPSTVTNASFVLRKFYLTLLQTYEQTYFIQEGASQLLPSDVKASTMSEALPPPASPPLENMPTKLDGTEGNPILEQEPITVGSMVKGKIHGKFEEGYLVTANFGSETFNGVLYYVPLKPSQSPYSGSVVSHSRGRKRSKKEADPSTPKMELGGYNLFVAEQYSKLSPMHSGKERVIFKLINDLWDKLTVSERQVYIERSGGK